MKIKDMIRKINTSLAGEMETYKSLVDLMDAVIDDVNDKMNTCFPVISEWENFCKEYNKEILKTAVIWKTTTTIERTILASEEPGPNPEDPEDPEDPVTPGPEEFDDMPVIPHNAADDEITIGDDRPIPDYSQTDKEVIGPEDVDDMEADADFIIDYEAGVPAYYKTQDDYIFEKELDATHKLRVAKTTQRELAPLLRPIYSKEEGPLAVEEDDMFGIMYRLTTIEYLRDEQDLLNPYDYTAIPDRYLRSLLVGVAYKYYIRDEEGEKVASEYWQNYQQALFTILRDYDQYVPEIFRSHRKGYITGHGGEMNDPYVRLYNIFR